MLCITSVFKYGREKEIHKHSPYQTERVSRLMLVKSSRSSGRWMWVITVRGCSVLTGVWWDLISRQSGRWEKKPFRFPLERVVGWSTKRWVVAAVPSSFTSLLVVVPKSSPPFPVPYCTPVCSKNTVTAVMALASLLKKNPKAVNPFERKCCKHFTEFKKKSPTISVCLLSFLHLSSA